MGKQKKFTLSEFARIGGKARAKKLTAEQRSEAAREAAKARWDAVRAKAKAAERKRSSQP